MFLAIASALPHSSVSMMTLFFFLPHSENKSCFMLANLQTHEYRPNDKICACAPVCVCAPFPPHVSVHFVLKVKLFAESYREAAAARVRIPRQPPETPSHKGMRARAHARTHIFFTAFPHTRPKNRHSLERA